MLTSGFAKINMATYRNKKTGEVITESEYNSRFGSSSSTPTNTKKTSTSAPLQERLGNSLGNTGTRIQEDITGTGNAAGQSDLRRGVDATAAAFSGTLSVGKELLPEPARQAIDYVGGKAGEGFSWLTDKIASTQLFKEIGELEAQGYINPEANPGLAKIKETLGTLSSGGELAGDILAADFGVKAPVKGARPAINATADTLKGAGEQMYRTTIVPEESTRMALQGYQAAKPNLFQRVGNLIKGEADTAGPKPITEADTAARHGLAGTEWQLGVQAKRVANQLWNDTIVPGLQQVQGKVNVQDFFQLVRKDIMENTREPNLRQSRLDALDDLKSDYGNTSHASLEELQGFKEGWAEKVPESAYKGKVPGNAMNYVRDIAASRARGIIYRHAGTEVKQAYIDYGNLKSIMKAGIKATADPAKKSLSRNIWEFLMNQAITPVATIGGQVLYRTGQGLEFVGGRGAKKVKDIIEPNDIPTRINVQDMGSGTQEVTPTIPY